MRRGAEITAAGPVRIARAFHHTSPAESETQLVADYNPYEQLPQVAAFELTSEDVGDGEELEQPQLSGPFAAGGEDVSPQLAWSGSQTRRAASLSRATTRRRRRPAASGTGRSLTSRRT